MVKLLDGDQGICVRFLLGQEVFLFSTVFRPAMKPTQPHIQWVWGLFPHWKSDPATLLLAEVQTGWYWMHQNGLRWKGTKVILHYYIIDCWISIVTCWRVAVTVPMFRKEFTTELIKATFQSHRFLILRLLKLLLLLLLWQISRYFGHGRCNPTDKTSITMQQLCKPCLKAGILKSIT
jgi:hypothetical protein